MKPEPPKPDPLTRLLATIEARRTQHETTRRDREDAKLARLRNRRRGLWWERI